MSKLVQLVYVSLSSKDLSEQSLTDLLVEIREKNKRQDVTGMLLYHNSSFIQVIEGEQDTIDQLFDKLKKDQRHKNILVLLEHKIDQRSFPNWSMGFQEVDDEDAKGLEGFTKFMEAVDKEKYLANCTKEVMHMLNNFAPAKPIPFPESRFFKIKKNQGPE